MEIITNFLTQIVFSVGVIVIFGLLIAFCRKSFCKISGENGTKILLITGIVGTPIHELSHALMCVIFGHKITEIKLYQPNSPDNTLGYVKHSYNPKNLYQQIGNFFIGIAPILGGSALISLLMYLFTPSLFTNVYNELEFIELISFDLLDLSTYEAIFSLFFDVFIDIFDFTNMGNALWWVFIVLAIMIASHMELSLADIKGGLKGFGFLAIVLLVFDIIMYFVSIQVLEKVTAIMVSFAANIIGFLAIAVIFLVVMVLIAISVKGLLKIKR